MERYFPEEDFFIDYAGKAKLTRLVEYNRFMQHQSPTTLIGFQIPSKNSRHYLVPIRSEIKKPQRYLAELSDQVFRIGRNGSDLG